MELCIVLSLLLSPLCMIASLMGYVQLVLLPGLLASIYLLLENLLSFVRHLYLYGDGGCVSIFIFHMLFVLPVLLLFIGCALPLQTGTSWVLVAGVLSASKLFSLPLFYMQRPVYALMGLVVFLQTSACLLAVGIRLDKGPGQSIPILPCLPGITAALSVMLCRKWLVDIWDVCLHIRPGQPEHNEELRVISLVGSAARKGSSALVSSLKSVKISLPSRSRVSKTKTNIRVPPPAVSVSQSAINNMQEPDEQV